MQLKLLQHFNISSDLLGNELIRGARYDVGELNRYLVGMKPVIHISLFNKTIDATYFRFTKSVSSNKESSSNELIYFPAPSTELLKQVGPSNVKTSKFYFVVTGHVDQLFLTTAAENKVERFNFSKAFKKSNLKDWTILLASTEGIKPNCSLLNAFLSLGADLKVLGDSQNITSADVELKDTIALSLQHSIEIYELKKS